VTFASAPAITAIAAPISPDMRMAAIASPAYLEEREAPRKGELPHRRRRLEGESRDQWNPNGNTTSGSKKIWCGRIRPTPFFFCTLRKSTSGLPTSVIPPAAWLVWIR
jgi:hypothetical protein